jgi:hypothetical protein
MIARQNPFRTECIQKIPYRLDGITWDDLFTRFKKQNYRGSLIGEQGSGKTTLLENFADQLTTRGFRVHLFYLNHQSIDALFRLLPRLGAKDILFLDSSEVLSRWRWSLLRWKMRSAGGLMITSHRLGMLPLLYHCKASPDLLKNLATELWGGSDLPSHISTDDLYQRHAGNVRHALLELYDCYAESFRS